MAEGTSGVKKDSNESECKEKGDALECAVCLQTCVHPAQLPCGHIFCFLCVKGIANQSKRCAMCRQEIPRDFIEQPKLLQTPESTSNFDGSYQWFYEGRNGWWRYDQRTNEDIEQAYQLKFNQIEILICGELYIVSLEDCVQFPKRHPLRKRSIKRDVVNNVILKGWWQYDERTSKELETCYKVGERTCELLIAGFLYIADLDGMLQMRRNDPSRRRRIKRDLATIPKKGVAGLRTEGDQQSNSFIEYTETESQRAHTPTGQIDSVTPVTPSNTPQTPASGRESPHQEDLQATVERIRSLRLDPSDNTNLLRTVHRDNSDNESDSHQQDDQRSTIAHNRFRF